MRLWTNKYPEQEERDQWREEWWVTSLVTGWTLQSPCVIIVWDVWRTDNTIKHLLLTQVSCNLISINTKHLLRIKSISSADDDFMALISAFNCRVKCVELSWGQSILIKLTLYVWLVLSVRVGVDCRPAPVCWYLITTPSPRTMLFLGLWSSGTNPLNYNYFPSDLELKPFEKPPIFQFQKSSILLS